MSANVQLVFTQLLYGQREAARTRALRLAARYPQQPAFCICPALAAAVEGDSLGANEHTEKSMKLVGKPGAERLKSVCDGLTRIHNERFIGTWDTGGTIADLLKVGRQIWVDLRELRSGPPEPEEDEAPQSGLLAYGLRLPPAFVLAYPERLPTFDEIASEYTAATYSDLMRRLGAVHPDGVFMFLIGIARVPAIKKDASPEESQAIMKGFQAAQEAFQAAAETPSVFPSLRQQSCYSAAMCGFALYDRYHQADALASAVAEARKARSEGPLPVEYQTLFLCKGAMLNESYDLAQTLLDDLRRSDPMNPEYQQRQVDLYLRQRHYSRALQATQSRLGGKCGQ